MGIHINLDNPGNSCLAGEVMAGWVILKNARPLKFMEIAVTLRGVQRVCLYRHGIKTVEILHEKLTLADNENSPGPRQTLSVGTLAYRFHFRLPKNIPSSFEIPRADVIYLLIAEISRSGLFERNEQAHLRVRVKGMLDLNLEPNANLTQVCVRMKRDNVLTGRTGNISLSLALPKRSGFVPGEPIHFHACIKNTSNRKIIGMVACLVQVVDFFTSGNDDEGKKEQIVSLIRGPSLGQGCQELWTPTSLLVPEVPPTHLGWRYPDRLIDIQYYLCLRMDISGFTRSLVGRLPVVIGTVPLRANLANAVQASSPSARQNHVLTGVFAESTTIRGSCSTDRPTIL